jgi:hypothetical protein
VHLRPDGKRWDWASLLSEASSRDRARIMRDGTMPALESLAGWDFAGANTLRATRIVGIRKFIKGFYEGPPRTRAGPEPFIQGFNVVVQQNADAEPHLAKPSIEKPKRHGFYRVHPVRPADTDSLYANALLLDYSLGGNPWYDPSRVLRDYLVQVYPDDPNLLLGHAFAAVLGVRIPLSYFVLSRLREHSFRGA